jgi:hypothetical protein
MVCGEPVAPAAVTVTVPLGPAAAVTTNVRVPTPEVGFTVILDWLELTVQLAFAPAMVTNTVCGLVTNDPLVPKFNTFRLIDRLNVTVPP